MSYKNANMLKLKVVSSTSANTSNHMLKVHQILSRVSFTEFQMKTSKK